MFVSQAPELPDSWFDDAGLGSLALSPLRDRLSLLLLLAQGSPVLDNDLILGNFVAHVIQLSDGLTVRCFIDDLLND